MSLTWILLLLSGSSSFLSVLTNPVRRQEGVAKRYHLTGIIDDAPFQDGPGQLTGIIDPEQLTGIVPDTGFQVAVLDEFGKRDEKPNEVDNVENGQSTGVLVKRSGQRKYLALRHHEGKVQPVKEAQLTVSTDPDQLSAQSFQQAELTGIIDADRDFKTGIVIDPDQFGKRDDKPNEVDNVENGQSTGVLVKRSGQRKYLALRHHGGLVQPLQEAQEAQLTGIIDPYQLSAQSFQQAELTGIIDADRDFKTGIVIDPDQFGKRDDKPNEVDNVENGQSTGVLVKRSGQRKYLALRHHGGLVQPLQEAQEAQLTGIIDPYQLSAQSFQQAELTGIIDADRDFKTGIVIDPDQFGKRDEIPNESYKAGSGLPTDV